MTAANSTYAIPQGRGDNWAVRGVRNGLAASILMAMVMMVLGLFDRGLFAAPSSIWAFWAGPAAYQPTAISLGFVLGAMGHMMNSAVLGIAFALLAGRVLQLRGALTSVAVAVAFALVVMAVMWNVVLPLGPNGDIVKDSAATWIWALGHVVYGMGAGWTYERWR